MESVICTTSLAYWQCSKSEILGGSPATPVVAPMDAPIFPETLSPFDPMTSGAPIAPVTPAPVTPEADVSMTPSPVSEEEEPCAHCGPAVV